MPITFCLTSMLIPSLRLSSYPKNGIVSFPKECCGRNLLSERCGVIHCGVDLPSAKNGSSTCSSQDLESIAVIRSTVNCTQWLWRYLNCDYYFFWLKNNKKFPPQDIDTIENNWRSGNHNLQRINCRSENSKGVYCLQYDDNKIVSGLRDNTIKIWDRHTLQCNKVIQFLISHNLILTFSFLKRYSPATRVPYCACNTTTKS